MSNQSNDYAEQSTMAGWKFLTGDFNWQQYGGSWYRAVGERQYQVIELINLKDAMTAQDMDDIGPEFSNFSLTGG